MGEEPGGGQLFTEAAWVDAHGWAWLEANPVLTAWLLKATIPVPDFWVKFEGTPEAICGWV